MTGMLFGRMLVCLNVCFWFFIIWEAVACKRRVALWRGRLSLLEVPKVERSWGLHTHVEQGPKRVVAVPWGWGYGNYGDLERR